MFICARGEKFNFAKEIGVGLVESSIVLTSIILRENPSWLIFLGSAGSYDESIKPLTMFASNCATQIESSFTQRESYTPLENKIEIVSYETFGDSPSDSSDSSDSRDLPSDFNAILAQIDLPKAIVNSSNYIATNPLYATQMKNAGIALENMEFFAVLKVADFFKIPALGIFCITNHCDKNAHNDFVANQKDAQNRLESYVKNLKR